MVQRGCIFSSSPAYISYVPCDIGTYIDGSDCKLCSASTYSNVVDSVICTSCPAGTYSDTIGATDCQFVIYFSFFLIAIGCVLMDISVAVLA